MGLEMCASAGTGEELIGPVPALPLRPLKKAGLMGDDAEGGGSGNVEGSIPSTPAAAAAAVV
jgi:hypothetical protein